ncbi:MAG: ABC transporter ATP-binding protein [Candidatus Parvarchaeum sp.]
MENQDIIEIKGINKTYKNGKKRIQALKNVNLIIHKGEIFGILGQNGAGKTSLINIMSTLLIPDSGNIKVFGIDALKEPNKVRDITGYAGQDSEKSAFFRLTVFENLLFFAYAFRKVSKTEIKKNIKDLAKKMRFEKKLDKQFSTLSGGEKQTTIILRSIIHNPKLCFMDEPSKSLDPVTAKRFRGVIKELVRKTGMTIVLTTHNMQEAEELCDRIAFIKNGKIKFVGSTDEFRKSVGYTEKIIVYTAPDKKLAKKILSIKNIISFKLEPNSMIFYTNNIEKTTDKVFKLLRENRINAKISIRSVTVEDAFVEMMK